MRSRGEQIYEQVRKDLKAIDHSRNQLLKQSQMAFESFGNISSLHDEGEILVQDQDQVPTFPS